jgi:NTF2 fold immunity protein
MKDETVATRHLAFILFFLMPVLVLAGAKHNCVPPAGYVPDAKTAVRIAEAIWIPIYGAKTLADEKPFVATRRGDVWYVHGTMPKNTPGGTAEAEIDTRSGRILRVSHGK